MPRIRLYSILADAAGAREISVSPRPGSTYRSLLEDLAGERPGLARALEAIAWDVRVIADGVPRSLDDVVEGEIIHFLPPSAGGLHVEVGVLRRGETVSLDEVLTRITGSRMTGGVAVFIGVVRGVNQGEGVEELVYEHAEDLTEETLRRIAVEEAEVHGLTGVAVYHYTGRLRVGDLTMIVAVAGESRKNVFPALERIVERVKHEAPIWKLEVRKGGRRVYIVGDKYIDEREITAGGPSQRQPSPGSP